MHELNRGSGVRPRGVVGPTGAQTGAGPSRFKNNGINPRASIFTPAIPGPAELCKQQKYFRGQPDSFLTETKPRPVAYTREVASLAYPG